jgi:uncharacterized damage-inducible protein DinB
MDLHYPVGRFRRPTEWTEADRRAAIDDLGALPRALATAVAGLTDAQLDTPYRPGGWTARQVVHHVADSHLNMYIRVRFALTQDTPTIMPYDQEQWAHLPDARTLPVAVSLAMIEGIHTRLVALFRELDPAQFSRSFEHPDSGPQTLDSTLALYSWHGRHHTAHITALRTREGWN